jgi:superfamily II DNA or RNA helicase
MENTTAAAGFGLKFDRGTVLIDERLFERERRPLSDFNFNMLGIQRDFRTGHLRAPAYRYFEIKSALGISAAPVLGKTSETLALRDYQEFSLDAWRAASRRGIISLPTGAGKSLCGVAAVLECAVPSLILAPTRVLVHQWAETLAEKLKVPIGKLGDGEFDLQRITVATFESAYRQMARIGNRFGLLVIDEVHHFGGGVKDETLEMSVAPFRLGLSATLPTDEGRLNRLRTLVGDVVASISTEELLGKYLCNYRVLRIPIHLEHEDLEKYRQLRKIFLDYFLNERGQPRPQPQDFQQRTFAALKDPSGRGRAAILAWKRAQELTRLPAAKLSKLGDLFRMFPQKRGIVFTERTDDVYQIASLLRLPAITAEIGRKERENILASFSEGKLSWIVTCKVLNEGFDIPSAEIAIMTSPTSNAVERKQRLGRVLRRHSEKESATLIEFFCANTHEHSRLKRMTDGQS